MDPVAAVKELPAQQRPGAMAILFLLQNAGPHSVTELALLTRLSRQQLRTVLTKLGEAGVLTRDQPQINHKSTKITLTKTKTYKKDQTEINHKSTNLQPSKEAKKAAALWDDKRMLPSSDWSAYWEVFDQMHKLDGVEWNSETGIWAIVRHATTVWEPSHIQSPTKLRQKSRTYPELKTWEVIRNQMLQDQRPITRPERPKRGDYVPQRHKYKSSQ